MAAERKESGITLRQLEAFVAVARHGNYTKASSAIGLSQPALTMRIRDLENMLSIRLFDRTTRSVQLTSAGKEFLTESERLLQRFDALVSDAKALANRERGRVVIASLPSLACRLVAPAMARFKRSFPRITMKVYDGGAGSVTHRVRVREADFGLSERPDSGSEFEFTPLIRDGFSVLFRKDHPLARRRLVKLSRLADYPFLAMSPGTGIRRDIDAAAAKANVNLNIICEIEQLNTLQAMIEAGIGISAAPELAAAMVRFGSVISRPLSSPDLKRELGIVTCRNEALSPAADSFRQVVMAEIASHWDGLVIANKELVVTRLVS